MEFRKIISFGKNSYVITLPKTWITQNKMSKGDLIHIYDNGQDLILSKKESKKNDKEKTKVINIDGKSIYHLEREVNSAYILNYRTIILKGNEVRTNIRELQKLFENLIALEVMEQTPNSLTAKDFLNMDKVSMEELVRKMDIVTRTMLKESFIDFSEENYKGINERDRDVNRLYFLLYRTILFNLDNPLRAQKNFKLNSIDLMNILFSGYYLEGLADEVRRTSRYCKMLDINQKDKNDIKDLLKRINDHYLKTMKSFYNKEVSLALELSSVKNDFNQELDLLMNSHHDIKNYSNVVARIRRLLSFIHNLGRIVYQGYNYFDTSNDLESLIPEKESS